MILDIISQHTTADTHSNKELFLDKFKQLYQLPILHPTLNLVATKAKRGELTFKVIIPQHWDRLAGHCKTSSVFKKVKGVFKKQHKHEIVIKKLESDIIMHEIAHAMEKESGIDINKEFRTVLGYDMNSKTSGQLFITQAVTSVMQKELKNYKLENVMTELFARYFELLAMSYEVGGYSRYKFKYTEITEYFKNTTNWTESHLNPLLSKHCDSDIRQAAEELYSSLIPYKKEWTKEVGDSTHYSKQPIKHTASAGKWSAKTTSSLDWQKQYEDLAGKFLDSNNNTKKLK